MTTRGPMNSTALQERFPEVYRELFTNCPIVVSAPLQFLWTGEYSVLYGAPALTQNIPRRVWVGLDTRNERDPQVYRCFAYDDQFDRFRKYELPGCGQSELKTLIEESLPAGETSRLKLEIIAETPMLAGAIFQGALVVAALSALRLFSRELTSSQLIEWQKGSILIDSRKISVEFDDMIRLAWRWSAILGRYNASGVHILPKFLVSLGPMIYKKWTKGSVDWHDINPSYQARSQYAGIPIEPFLDNRPLELPLDIALVSHPAVESTGTEVRATTGGRRAFRQTIAALKHLDTQIDRLFLIKGLPQTDHYSNAIDSLHWLAAKTCLNLIQVGQSGFTESLIEDLCQTINQYQQSLKLIGAFPRHQEHVVAALKEHLGYFDRQAVGVKVVGSYGSGCYLVVAPYGALRHIEIRLTRLRRHLRLPLWLYYASWRDGYESDGVRVDQCLADQCYSRYIRSGAVQVRHLNLDGDLHTDLYTFDQFPRIRENDDLCLDGVEDAVYVRGTRLTSRELHSSAVTVALFKILIERAGQTIRNTELPDSSYTRDRNELQSKVVSPLVRIIKERTRRRLPLIIHGSLTDFTVQLDAGEVDIDLVEKYYT